MSSLANKLRSMQVNQERSEIVKKNYEANLEKVRSETPLLTFLDEDYFRISETKSFCLFRKVQRGDQEQQGVQVKVQPNLQQNRY